MIKNHYDLIVTTGCSHSCGMEMNDHLLPAARTVKERQTNIIQWCKSNYKLPYEDIYTLKDHAFKAWEDQERKESWPTQLQNKLNIPVVNLARIGASTGRSLLDYSEYLTRSWEGKNTAVIHQIPAYGRMYMRFNCEYGRINMVPGHIGEIGFDKKYFSKEIKNIERKYRDAVTNDYYMKTYHNKVLGRLSKLSRDRKITAFYIFDEPNHNFADNVILDNFPAFRNSYSKGTFGHTNDARFNTDLCELISPYLA